MSESSVAKGIFCFSFRPFTSIKCIFQVETDDRGSLLDYSENQVQNDIFTEGRKGKEQRDSHGSYYSIAASNVGFTPLQTEVARPIQKEVANEINARKRKDSTSTARRWVPQYYFACIDVKLFMAKSGWQITQCL